MTCSLYWAFRIRSLLIESGILSNIFGGVSLTPPKMLWLRCAHMLSRCKWPAGSSQMNTFKGNMKVCSDTNEMSCRQVLDNLHDQVTCMVAGMEILYRSNVWVNIWGQQWTSKATCSHWHPTLFLGLFHHPTSFLQLFQCLSGWATPNSHLQQL